MAKSAFKVYRGHEKRNTFIRGFLRGASEGIKAQLAENAQREAWKAKEADKAGPQATETQKMEIMNINMQLQEIRRVEQFINDTIRFSKKTSSGSSLSGRSGRTQGFEAGKKINISSGLGSGAKVNSERWLK